MFIGDFTMYPINNYSNYMIRFLIKELIGILNSLKYVYGDHENNPLTII